MCCEMTQSKWIMKKRFKFLNFVLLFFSSNLGKLDFRKKEKIQFLDCYKIKDKKGNRLKCKFLKCLLYFETAEKLD